MNKKRIEYIDALRGFTMLLVIYSHVSGFCLNANTEELFTYNDLFTEFRMPLFFFISGFVFYKMQRVWNCEKLKKFFFAKIKVQIISPLIFLFLFCMLSKESFIHHITKDFMGGYWFTFALFEFFLLYIALELVLGKIKKNLPNGFEGMLLFIGGILYVLTSQNIAGNMPIGKDILIATGFMRMHYFIFFCFGTIIKNHFESFTNALDKGYTTLLAIVTYIVVNVLMFTYSNAMLHFALYFIAGISGIIMVFAFFRKHQDSFSSNSRFGRAMQYVGRRTLDIYLIHYFFAKGSWINILPADIVNYPFIEFIVSFTLAIVVVGMCLVVSNILRTSPQIASFMFGQKNN